MPEDALEVCPYPQHQGERWEDVVVEDRGYVEFLVSDAGPTMNEELYDFLIDLLEETPDV